MIFAACKDPNIGPTDPKEPVEDAGYIKFDSPAVGQKSSFVHFFSKGYYDPNPAPLSYTRDTVYWEITKQINGNTFVISENLSIGFDVSGGSDVATKLITLVKEKDRILLLTEKETYSVMLGYKDTLSLPLGNKKKYEYKDWRIGDNSNVEQYSGYVINYKVKDKQYERLDFISDFVPTTYDGAGLLFAYNGGYGMVRHYAMNPWLGDVSGYDLVRHNPTPNSLVGSKWRLKNVVYDDLSVKSIEELYWGDKNNFQDPGFNLFIKSDTEVSGRAGCNTYGGEYSLNKDTITIKNIFSTEVGCPYYSEYLAILSESTTYNSNGETLIINTSYSNVRSIVFERITEDVEEFPLENTEWVLRNVHYTNGEIVPIGKILGDDSENDAFNRFVLQFKEDNIVKGFAGCNTYGGTYKVEKSRIQMNAGPTTLVACKFTNDFTQILKKTTKFKADPQRLIIYTELEPFKALEFDRVK